MVMKTDLTKGNLLIGTPKTLTDAFFSRSVVLLAEHDMKASVGFILNKPLGFTVNEFVDEIEGVFPVYFGGPVSHDNLYFLHVVPELISESIEISSGVFWGGDFKEMVFALNKKHILSHQIRFFLGYSGWEVDQLADELKQQDWEIISNHYGKDIFKQSTDNFWKNELLDLGGTFTLWSNAPEDPSFN